MEQAPAPQSRSVEGAERFLHKHELHVAAPDEFWIIRVEVGAEQIATFALTDLPEVLAVEFIGEPAGGRYRHLHQRGRGTGCSFGLAEFDQEFVTWALF